MIERWRHCRACGKETKHYRRGRNEDKPWRRADRGLLALPHLILNAIFGPGEGRWTCWKCLKRESDARRKREWEEKKAARRKRKQAQAIP